MPLTPRWHRPRGPLQRSHASPPCAPRAPCAPQRSPAPSRSPRAPSSRGWAPQQAAGPRRPPSARSSVARCDGRSPSPARWDVGLCGPRAGDLEAQQRATLYAREALWSSSGPVVRRCRGSTTLNAQRAGGRRGLQSFTPYARGRGTSTAPRSKVAACGTPRTPPAHARGAEPNGTARRALNRETAGVSRFCTLRNAPRGSPETAPVARARGRCPGTPRNAPRT